MHRTCSARGTTLAYEIEAGDRASIDGLPLVWSHGLLSSRAIDDRTHTVDLSVLRTRRPVVRYDAIGHGESACADDVARYGWNELAADQLALADHLGLDRYVSGGESMGAATAVLAAMQAPERIAGLVLVTPPCAWHTRPQQAAEYLLAAQLIERGDALAVAEFIAATSPPGPFVDDPSWPARAAAAADALTSPTATVCADILRGAAQSDLPPPAQLTHRLTMPTLILCWTDDHSHPVSTGEALAAAIPRAELVVSSRNTELAKWSQHVTDFIDTVAP
jgi:pimeloyl-ACP methyl ester carboxylesterase